MSDLTAAWLRTMDRVGGGRDVSGAGADLLARYGEPHRRYHDVVHLDEVLHRVDDLAAGADQPDTVRLAAWFHDAVYGPGGEDEQRSAELARAVLARLQVPTALVEEVARLVRLTATHEPATSDRDGAVLCDADLAILAADPARYAAYAVAVRAEWPHLSDAEFARGRAAVLERLLDRPALFRTPPARDWEPRARRNVRAELARLAP
jgi:predicted metal-dependent HD superfamily phosphohydrolase